MYPVFIVLCSQFVKKSCEAHTELWFRWAFAYVEATHQSDCCNQWYKAFLLMQIIFKTWFIYFVYAVHIPSYNGDYSQVMSRFDLDLNWSTRPWSSVQQEIFSSKLHKPLLACLTRHSSFSIKCKFFLRLSRIFIFLKKLPKMLLISFQLQC